MMQREPFKDHGSIFKISGVTGLMYTASNP